MFFGDSNWVVWSQIWGRHSKGKELKLLVDCGSFLNFLNKEVAKELGCLMHLIDLVIITLPNGEELQSKAWCPEFSWTIDNRSFSTPVWVINLQQHDAILGTAWMKQLGAIHNKLLMKFLHLRKEIQLQGIRDQQPTNFPPCNYLTTAQPAWMSQIIESYEGDDNVSEVIAELSTTKMGPNEFELLHGLFKYRGKWVIGFQGELRMQLFEKLHEKGVGGHSGTRATLKRIEQYFY